MNFVNPANLVSSLELSSGATVADFGCGAGFFCIPAAQMAGKDGTVYAVDIMPPRLEATASAARHSGLQNVVTIQADLERPIKDASIPPVSCDWVLVGSVLHQVQEKHTLLGNAYRILKTGGRILIMEWQKGFSLFGPPQKDRVSFEELSSLCEKLGLRLEKTFPVDKFHYAAVFVK
jgi:ubiquinone/menaquinone biosynthesis C-methylase UbiE